MSEYIKVAVDAMGGDYAPQEPVKGVIDALNEKPELFVYLVGQEEVLKKELEKYSYPKDRLEVVHASEIIETGEPPVQAIQKKKDSSIVVGLNLVKKHTKPNQNNEGGGIFDIEAPIHVSNVKKVETKKGKN